MIVVAQTAAVRTRWRCLCQQVVEMLPYDKADDDSRRPPLKEINTTINPWGRHYRNNLRMRPGAQARMRRKRKFLSFLSSSSFNAITTATATDAAPADNTEAPAKDRRALRCPRCRRRQRRWRGGSRDRAAAGFELLLSDHTTNNAAAGQDEVGEEQGGGEWAGVRFLLRTRRNASRVPTSSSSSTSLNNYISQK